MTNKFLSVLRFLCLSPFTFHLMFPGAVDFYNRGDDIEMANKLGSLVLRVNIVGIILSILSAAVLMVLQLTGML